MRNPAHKARVRQALDEGKPFACLTHAFCQRAVGFNNSGAIGQFPVFKISKSTNFKTIKMQRRMKFNLFNLLLIGSVLSLVMLNSCDKDDDNEVTPENPDYTQNAGEFKDSRDGNIYKWVKIGEQIWMAENLAYIGDGIQNMNDVNEWQNSDYLGWCYYENNANYGKSYGVLYQWEAAKVACPSGWHIPTDEEWTKLENYLKENGYSFDGVVGNDGIAKSLATNAGWSISDNEGAIGNSDFSEFRNKTGFSGLPGGYRSSGGGTFDDLGTDGFWWSTTESWNDKYYSRQLSHQNADVYRFPNFTKSGAISVRCIKD